MSIWARRRETWTQQVGPRVRATGNLSDRSDAAWSSGPRHKSVPDRGASQFRTAAQVSFAAQVASFRLFRSRGPPSNPKPRGHSPRSKSGSQATQGREGFRLSTGGAMWRVSAGTSGRGWTQACPRAGSTQAGPDRSTELEEPASGQLVGAKQHYSEGDARER